MLRKCKMVRRPVLLGFGGWLLVKESTYLLVVEDRVFAEEV